MSDEISFQKYSKRHLQSVLELSSRSMSTSRTELTWTKNNMVAVLAFSGESLIGAIPLEIRNLSVGSYGSIRVAWVSGAHVDIQFRSMGIGSRMDALIEKFFAPYVKGVFVYRGDTQSAAFRWYERNRYQTLARIISFEKEAQCDGPKCSSFEVLTTLEDLEHADEDLGASFERKYRGTSGYVSRTPSYWADKIKFHLYKEYYEYSILVLKAKSGFKSYAFIGQTSLGDGLPRLDIFEFVALENERKGLLECLMRHAVDNNIPRIRIRLAEQDPDSIWFRENNFKRQSEFFVKTRMFDSSISIRVNRHFHSDYI